MANEISVNVNLTVRNGNLIDSTAPGVKQYTQAAVGGPSPGFITVATSVESPTLSEISTLGWCIMQNLDTTNYVRWGFATGVYGGRMEAGETAGPFRLNPGTTLFMIADTSPCKCLVKVFED